MELSGLWAEVPAVTRVIGADISLNHGAMVELTDGERTGFWYYTNIASSASRSKEHGARIRTKTKDTDRARRQQFQMERLAWVGGWITRRLKESAPDLFCLEDYAVRAEQGAHYLGEVGGLARLQCFMRGIRLRLHDPMSLKLFVTHDGSAQKDLMEEFVKERWGWDYGQFNPPPPKNPKQKQNRVTSEDLADASSLAQLGWAEWRIRKGEITMADLAHDQERRVFNRTTKTYPTNLLDRDWIQR